MVHVDDDRGDTGELPATVAGPRGYPQRLGRLAFRRVVAEERNPVVRPVRERDRVGFPVFSDHGVLLEGYGQGWRGCLLLPAGRGEGGQGAVVDGRVAPAAARPAGDVGAVGAVGGLPQGMP